MEAASLYAYAGACQRDVACVAHVTNTMATQGDDFDKGDKDGTNRILSIAAIARALRYRVPHGPAGGKDNQEPGRRYLAGYQLRDPGEVASRYSRGCADAAQPRGARRLLVQFHAIVSWPTAAQEPQELFGAVINTGMIKTGATQIRRAICAP